VSYQLGGGFKYFIMFIPNLGNIPFLTNLFKWVVQPPTSSPLVSLNKISEKKLSAKVTADLKKAFRGIFHSAKQKHGDTPDKAH